MRKIGLFKWFIRSKEVSIVMMTTPSIMIIGQISVVSTVPEFRIDANHLIVK